MDRIHHEPVHKRVRARPAARRDARAGQMHAEPARDEYIAKQRERGLRAADQRDERGGRGEQATTSMTR